MQAGPRANPLGAEEQYGIAAHAGNGNGNIPAETLALSPNVTALDDGTPTFATVFPTDAAPRVTSTLDLVPGQARTPNAVTTGLDGAGMFSVYNAFVTTHVIVDVNGYDEDHNHDDRYGPGRFASWVDLATVGPWPRSASSCAWS